MGSKRKFFFTADNYCILPVKTATIDGIEHKPNTYIKMISKTNTNTKSMSNSINGAQVDGKAMNAHRNNESIDNRAIREAYEQLAAREKEVGRVSRSPIYWFGVKYETIARKRRQMEKGERPCGCICDGKYQMKEGPNVYVSIVVRERQIDGRSAYPLTLAVAYCGLEKAEVEVEFTTLRSYECSLEKAYVDAARKAVRMYANQEAQKTYGMTLEEMDAMTKADAKQYQLDSIKAEQDAKLDEAGTNALALARLLVEANQTIGSPLDWIFRDDEYQIWTAYRAEIERRLESLGDGTGTHTPCLTDEAENSGDDDNNNNGDPAPGLRDELAGMLAADWEKMDETEDGYDIAYHRVDGYWLQTTADCDADHGWMHVSLRLTPELEKKYVTDAHEAWEMCWRVEWDEDIEMVADALCRAMENVPRTFFREDAQYRGDDGYTYTLCAVNWDEGRDRYIVDVENEYGDPYTGVMDAEATVVTVYDDINEIQAVFHAEDVIE